MALFWSRGVDVLINMPAASLGHPRKRGDLVKERDGTRWNAMECLSILPRLAYTSECSLEWELHTHTHFQNHGVLVARNPSTALGIVVIA